LQRNCSFEKEKFDAVLSALLKSKPITREKIKTRGNRGSQTAMFSNSLLKKGF